MSTTTLYDSDVAADVPDAAEAVAGYVDGNGADWADLATRFAGKPVVSITRAPPGHLARVADVETGALTVEQGALWARDEIGAGRRPTLYYARANAGAVQAALGAAGVAVGACDYWVADWTGQPHLLSGSVATQYASPTVPAPGQGHYDLSMAEWDWLVPSIIPVPQSQPEEEDVQPLTTVVASNGDIVTMYVTPDNHLLEITRANGKQGLPLAGNGSIIDLTSEFPAEVPS